MDPTRPNLTHNTTMQATAVSAKSGLGAAQGKLIIVGEHSVVYGHPAVVIPFNQVKTVATVEQIDGPSFVDSELYKGPLAMLPNELLGLGQCIAATLRHLGRTTEGHLIRIQSTIPPSRGLGSSAAVAAAVVRSLYAYDGQMLEHSSLVKLANIAELYAHGKPSGIDLAAVTSENPLWFQKGHPIEVLDVEGEFHFVVADSGRVGNTRSAVAAVRARLESDGTKLHSHMNRLCQISYAVREAFRAHHLQSLGSALNAAQTELEEIGLSDSVLNDLVFAARNVGALGAKLTGSGCGGCMLALARTRDHVRTLVSALRMAGAVECWEFTIGGRMEHEGVL